MENHKETKWTAHFYPEAPQLGWPNAVTHIKKTEYPHTPVCIIPEPLGGKRVKTKTGDRNVYALDVTSIIENAPENADKAILFDRIVEVYRQEIESDKKPLKFYTDLFKRVFAIIEPHYKGKEVEND